MMERETTEMELRVAKAVYDDLREDYENSKGSPSYIGLGDNLTSVTIDGIFDLASVARAAIRAMYEPTQAMVDAPVHVTDYQTPPYEAKAVWQAMIDCASPPDPAPQG